VVHSYGAGVRLIRQPHLGVSAARNLGVESASANWIAFLDSDDFWEPDHLERMAGAITATKGQAWLYFSDLRLHPKHGGSSIWARCGLAIDGPFELRETDKDWLFTSRQPIMIQASAVPREAYVEVGGSDTRLARRSDTHLIFKLGLGGPLCAVAGVAGEWTAGADNSLTQTVSPAHAVYLRSTTCLYSDLLDTQAMSRQQRRILSKRLAASHLTLARQAGIRAPIRVLSHLHRATHYDPAGTAHRLVAFVKRNGSVRRSV